VKEGKISKMVGTVRFNLEPPDGFATDAEANADANLPPEVEILGLEAAVPAAPRLPFALDSGSFTQLWTSQPATTTAKEMKVDMESYIEAYTSINPDYPAIQTNILNASDWMDFLTVLAGNQVVLIHSLGLFSVGLGRPTPAHNRMFGLLGEKVGTGLPPIVMAPEAGLVPWISIQTRHQPSEASLRALEVSTALTIALSLDQEGTDDVSVQNICFVPKAWAAYFLASMSPWDALKVFRRLLHTIPQPLKSSFGFLGAWLAIACRKEGADGDSVLKARWKSPPTEQRMIAWIQRRTDYLNGVPSAGLTGTAGITLDPQECCNKALETVAALRPPSETAATRRYTPAEMQRLRAACSLTVPEMETSLPTFHEQLLIEGRTKKGTEAVLAQALRPRDDTDDPGLVYMSPELVIDIKNCKYGLGWDTSY
jgi:hypothetical protein